MIIADPIIVFAKLTIVWADESDPSNLELLRTLILYYLCYGVRSWFYATSSIWALTRASWVSSMMVSIWLEINAIIYNILHKKL